MVVLFIQSQNCRSILQRHTLLFIHCEVICFVSVGQQSTLNEFLNSYLHRHHKNNTKSNKFNVLTLTLISHSSVQYNSEEKNYFSYRFFLDLSRITNSKLNFSSMINSTKVIFLFISSEGNFSDKYFFRFKF